MKINNIILVLRTRIILLSSFVIYFFCICHSGRFPIIHYSPVVCLLARYLPPMHYTLKFIAALVFTILIFILNPSVNIIHEDNIFQVLGMLYFFLKILYIVLHGDIIDE